MTTALLHFGLAKTATTYLQKEVFPKSEGLQYLGKPFLSAPRSLSASVKSGRWRAPLDRFVTHEAALRRGDLSDERIGIISRQLARALHRDRLNLWSHEGLLRPTRTPDGFDRGATLRNMRRVFERAGCREVHALIMLRDTRKLMASYARQFFKEVEERDIDLALPSQILALQTAKPTDTRMQEMWDIWYRYFDFRSLLADLLDVFGENRVHILRYEAFGCEWTSTEDIFRSLNSSVKMHFPDVRVNDSLAKTARPSRRLEQHLTDLARFDVDALYPENARLLSASRAGTRQMQCGTRRDESSAKP